MPHPPLTIEDEPRGARGMWHASLQRVGSVSGTRGDSCAHGRDRGLVVQLSQLVMEISNALVDLGMLPIQNIPYLRKSVWEVLTVASLPLERLREAQASSTIPWDWAWASCHAHGLGLSDPTSLATSLSCLLERL
jgi:hypothetical protein